MEDASSEEIIKRFKLFLKGMDFSKFHVSKIRLNPDFYCVGRTCVSNAMKKEIKEISLEDAENIAATGLLWLSYGVETGRRSKETENEKKNQ